MPNKLQKKVVLALGLALILVGAGIATASNMGFKFVASYSPDPALTPIGLPYFQSQFTDAKDMFNDITGATQVCHIGSSQTFPDIECWLGAGVVNFTINNEEGLLTSATGGATQVLVGSHDPSKDLSLDRLDPDLNFKSIPYHTSYADAKDVFNDITGATQVCRINTASGYPDTECWLGAGVVNFALTIGEPLLIGVSPTTTWKPDHY